MLLRLLYKWVYSVAFSLPAPQAAAWAGLHLLPYEGRKVASAAQLHVPGNMRRMGLNQIMGLVCLQASCASLRGRRKFFALKQAGNQELCASCICCFFFPCK